MQLGALGGRARDRHRDRPLVVLGRLGVGPERGGARAGCDGVAQQRGVVPGGFGMVDQVRGLAARHLERTQDAAVHGHRRPGRALAR